MYRHSGAGSAFTASRQPLHTRVTRGTSGSAPITSRGAQARLTILLRARGEADDEDESDASDSATIEKILSNISEGKSPQSAPTRVMQRPSRRRALASSLRRRVRRAASDSSSAAGAAAPDGGGISLSLAPLL